MKYPLNRGGGKGDKPRPVDKKAYDETWIRCFGKQCPECKGTGDHNHEHSSEYPCTNCNGIGKVEK